MHGNADLRPRTVLADRVDGPYALVLLAVKAYSLDEAMGDLAPASAPRPPASRCSTACAARHTLPLVVTAKPNARTGSPAVRAASQRGSLVGA
jgi:hypothetical protein